MKHLITLIAALGLLFNPFRPAAQAQDQWEVVTGHDEQVYTDLVMTSADLGAFTSATNASLDSAETIVLRQQDLVLVVVNLAKSNNRATSFSAAIDGSSNTIMTSSGLRYAERVDGAYDFATWINGSQNSSLIIREDMVLSGWVAAHDGVRTYRNYRQPNNARTMRTTLESTGLDIDIVRPTDTLESTSQTPGLFRFLSVQSVEAEFWDCMNRVLSSAGLPFTIITGLSLICGVACSALAPAVAPCIACLTLAAAAFVGVVIPAAIYCWQYER